jgi:hypothetical protein
MSNITQPASIAKRLGLSDLKAAFRERQTKQGVPTLFIRSGTEGLPIQPGLAPKYRGTPPRIKTRLTDAQREIVHRVVSGSDPTEPLTILLAASEHAPIWPVGAMRAALKLAGYEAESDGLRRAINSMRLARFGEAARTSLEVVRRKKEAPTS